MIAPTPIQWLTSFFFLKQRSCLFSLRRGSSQMIAIANPLQSQRRSAPCWTVQSAQPVHYEHFLQHFCEHFLMDLLLSIIFHQLTQQGAAFQSSALMTIIVKLHFAPPTASPAVARLWETLYLRWTFRVSSTSLAMWAPVSVTECTQKSELDKYCVCTPPGYTALSSALMITTNHHRPARALLASLNILNSELGFPVPTSCWSAPSNTQIWPSPINKDNLGLSYAITISPHQLMSPHHWNHLTHLLLSRPGDFMSS